MYGDEAAGHGTPSATRHDPERPEPPDPGRDPASPSPGPRPHRQPIIVKQDKCQTPDVGPARDMHKSMTASLMSKSIPTGSRQTGAARRPTAKLAVDVRAADPDRLQFWQPASPGASAGAAARSVRTAIYFTPNRPAERKRGGTRGPRENRLDSRDRFLYPLTTAKFASSNPRDRPAAPVSTLEWTDAPQAPARPPPRPDDPGPGRREACADPGEPPRGDRPDRQGPRRAAEPPGRDRAPDRPGQAEAGARGLVARARGRGHRPGPGGQPRARSRPRPSG